MITPTPMLARQWEDRARFITYPAFSQAKLDGVRCMMNSRAGYSREGNPFMTVNHIHELLSDSFRQFPSLVFDGELYNHTYREDFNEIVSLVKKQRLTEAEAENTRTLLQYWIFDVHVRGWDWTFAERLQFIQSLPIAYAHELPVKIVPTYQCNTPEQINAHYETLLLDKYEGQMIRLNGPYEESGVGMHMTRSGQTNKSEYRSEFLIKRKPTITEEFPILVLNEGGGKCRSMVGSFTCLTKDSKGFEAAAKFDYPTRRRMWRDREPLRGQLATVKFQNYTPDGIPRFGRVVAIRNYE
jgi:DNA ligase-1